MWSNGADTNEDGEPILLLQPITSSKHKKKKCNPSPSSSHIGGSPCFYSGDVSPLKVAESIICTVCNEPMHLLLQLNAPLDDLERTLYVFGCNRPSCHVSAEDSEDCGGGNRFRINFDRLAAIRCFRSQQEPFVKRGQKQQVEINSESTPVSEKLEDNDWGNDNDWGTDDPNDDNDWGAASTTVAASNEVSMDDLEAMLSQAELQSKASTGAQPSKSIQSKASTSNNATNVADDIVPSFQRYNLEMFNEPPSTKLVHSDEDDDDDEMVSDNNIDSSKVNQMLSKYLDMEEDEEILSALKGSGGTQSGGGEVDVGERYERLPPEERAFLAFSKRLKRAPLQVVRYAYGGVPLWSIPHHRPCKRQIQEKKAPQSTKKQTKSTSPKHNNARISSRTVPPIPPCTCGSERIFEFQLLPSILHVLDVDSSTSTPEVDVDESTDINSVGGMNWGSIAVYSCPNSCDESREEVCVVQCGDVAVVRKKQQDGDDDGGNEYGDES